MYYDSEGHFLDTETRPRNICVPSANGCGILTAIQTGWWAPLKKIMPGYIQGMDCHAIRDRVAKYLKPHHKTMAADGSGWDSTQYTQLARAGTNKFFASIR